jgi:hypothetical protein
MKTRHLVNARFGFIAVCCACKLRMHLSGLGAGFFSAFLSSNLRQTAAYRLALEVGLAIGLVLGLRRVLPLSPFGCIGISHYVKAS